MRELEHAVQATLLGRMVLYYWPGDGSSESNRGTVARRSRNHGFSYVVLYGPRSALGTAMVDSLLSRCRLARAGRPLGPTVPDALL